MRRGAAVDSTQCQVTHSGHGLLVEGEGDVGAAVVLVTGAGVALGRRRRGRVGAPALAQVGAGLDEAVALADGDAALACGTAASTFDPQLAGHGPAPQLEGRAAVRPGERPCTRNTVQSLCRRRKPTTNQPQLAKQTVRVVSSLPLTQQVKF